MKLFQNIDKVTTAATDTVVSTFNIASKASVFVENELDLALRKQALDHQLELAVLTKVAEADIPTDKVDAIAAAKLQAMLDSLA